MKFNTALLHQNFDGEKSTGSTIMPIYQVSAFAHETAEKLEKVFHNQAPGFAYTRISNPTVKTGSRKGKRHRSSQLFFRHDGGDNGTSEHSPCGR